MSKKKKLLTAIVTIVVGLLVLLAIYLVLIEPKPALQPAPLPSTQEPFHGPTYPPTTTGPFGPPPSK